MSIENKDSKSASCPSAYLSLNIDVVDVKHLRYPVLMPSQVTSNADTLTGCGTSQTHRKGSFQVGMSQRKAPAFIPENVVSVSDCH